MFRIAAASLAAALLAACATVAPLEPAAGNASISGRLALRIDAFENEPSHALSAAFDLRGNANRGALGLSTPLGSLLAQAKWAAGEVVLATPQGTRRYADLDGLTRDVLGESVPVEAWFDWLHGRPWPGAPDAARDAGGFDQLGWHVDLARFADGNVVATRRKPLPVVTVRIQLDRS